MLQLSREDIPTEDQSPPGRCYLCDSRSGIASVGFRLLYPQKNSDPIPLDWWECRSCKGWFLYPIPSIEVIRRYWSTTDWSDPDREFQIAGFKKAVLERLLSELSHWSRPGPLLDFGCNFGQFMVMANDAGWDPKGFEPNADAAALARSKGFEVRSSWSIDAAGFSKESFTAITVIDVFCLVWDPISTVKALQHLLKPGGILAMRLTNKRFILGLLRACLSPGSARDATISKILLPQFHSIGLASLTRVLKETGFNRIGVIPNATTAPWRVLSRQAQAAYLAAGILYYLSLKKFNLSPGILLFAQKSIP